MAGLWRNSPDTVEGKYLVLRRDGTAPEWPYFVLGAKDPAAPKALFEYAAECKRQGMDPQYVRDVQDMANAWILYQNDLIDLDAPNLGLGDPDAPPHRKDNPETVALMRSAKPT